MDAKRDYAEDYLYANLNGDILNTLDDSWLIMEDLNQKIDATEYKLIAATAILAFIVVSSLIFLILLFNRSFQQTKFFMNLFLKARNHDFEILVFNLDSFLRIINE